MKTVANQFVNECNCPISEMSAWHRYSTEAEDHRGGIIAVVICIVLGLVGFYAAASTLSEIYEGTTEALEQSSQPHNTTGVY